MGHITNHEEVRDTLLKKFPQGATVNELARHMILSPSTVQRYLREMVRANWVTEVYNPFRNGRAITFRAHREVAKLKWAGDC